MADEPKPAAASQAKVNGANGSVFTILLRKSVIANGDEVKELSFREPTGGDIARVGNPVLMDFSTDPPGLKYDTRAMEAMMSVLAAVPPSTIKQMHPRDWNNAAIQLAGFFMPDL
jgi:hypothetical protein